MVRRDDEAISRREPAFLAARAHTVSHGRGSCQRARRCRTAARPRRSWNLDAWRPDVRYSDVLTAGCNP
ncbi:DUF2599 domain-containing protein [Microbacterium sp. LEMMJ01]|uniref:DUF2599 domain-containing protein n=1 Tax=Microbacterium sp. LEMMJ01 TaxID=1978350 RepID=UPI000A1E3C47|nr:hypothetical protein B7W94_03805 [Microbacterium sp. LEMMJ01]